MSRSLLSLTLPPIVEDAYAEDYEVVCEYEEKEVGATCLSIALAGPEELMEEVMNEFIEFIGQGLRKIWNVMNDYHYRFVHGDWQRKRTTMSYLRESMDMFYNELMKALEVFFDGMAVRGMVDVHEDGLVCEGVVWDHLGVIDRIGRMLLDRLNMFECQLALIDECLGGVPGQYIDLYSRVHSSMVKWLFNCDDQLDELFEKFIGENMCEEKLLRKHVEEKVKRERSY